ncbi:MAG TPA: hypothetical protein VGH28_14920 [Polyangiaceae bacterium]
MTPDEVLASLVELAKRTGIRVRFDEQMTADGGLCMVRGAPLVVLDVRTPPAAQAEILAAALARFGVLPIYLPRARPKRFALRH